MYVDVGGGSTEIYIYEKGEHIIQSFQLGAVRGMLAKEDPEEWKRLEKWLRKQSKIDNLIGLGGNIRSFLNINNAKKMSSENFIERSNNLSSQNVEDKIANYKLGNDRADVIDHALHIFKFISEHLMVETITSTRWGVSDSIGVKLFHEIYSNKINIS